MSFMSRINRIANEYRAAKARRLTERSVRTLPREVQIDIGWPHAYRHNTLNHTVTGGWY